LYPDTPSAPKPYTRCANYAFDAASVLHSFVSMNPC
jgi:hypothetical protein